MIVRRRGKIVYRKKIERKRAVGTPHRKSKATERVRHGHAMSVIGWLGFSDGAALAGRSVQILTAPDNGLGQFTATATATNGIWTADLSRDPDGELADGDATASRREPHRVVGSPGRGARPSTSSASISASDRSTRGPSGPVGRRSATTEAFFPTAADTFDVGADYCRTMGQFHDTAHHRA
jgi:hypothetical protein